MRFLSPEILARVRYLPTGAYGMTWHELRRYLVDLIELMDRQSESQAAIDRTKRSI